jgi:hypothetical protein
MLQLFGKPTIWTAPVMEPSLATILCLVPPDHGADIVFSDRLAAAIILFSSRYYHTLAGLSRAPNSRSWSDLVIAPAASAEVLTQLSYASASIDTPMGLASSSWELGHKEICGEVAEKSNLTLTCAGGLFESVKFASYGTPRGSCSGIFFSIPSISKETNGPS